MSDFGKLPENLPEKNPEGFDKTRTRNLLVTALFCVLAGIGINKSCDDAPQDYMVKTNDNSFRFSVNIEHNKGEDVTDYNIYVDRIKDGDGNEKFACNIFSDDLIIYQNVNSDTVDNIDKIPGNVANYISKTENLGSGTKEAIQEKGEQAISAYNENKGHNKIKVKIVDK